VSRRLPLFLQIFLIALEHILWKGSHRCCRLLLPQQYYHLSVGSGSDLVSGQRDQMARPAEIISMYRTFLKHGALNLAKLFDLKGDE
jgi:hypothetical protein